MWNWRFFKRIKIFNWITINFSKKGVSFSFGPQGAKYTIGHRGITKTLGAPNTGLYVSERDRIDEEVSEKFKYSTYLKQGEKKPDTLDRLRKKK